MSIRDSLVLDMRFKEGTGTVVRDQSGYDLVGALTPGAGGWAAGKFGKGRAIEFDALDTVVVVPDNAGIQNIWDGGGSLSIWMNPGSDGEGSNGRVFSKGWELVVVGEAGGKVVVRFIVPFSVDNGAWMTSAVVPIDEDTHIGITYDADADTNDPTFYINGRSYTVGNGLTEEDTPDGVRTTDAGSILYIGNNAASTRTFEGKLDSPLLYPRIISNREDRELYEESK